MKIISFKHKGLEAFYTTGSQKGIQSEHAKRLRAILDYLQQAENMEAVASVNSFRTHQLKGNRAGIWSITVRANWRVTLAVKGDACELLDYEDYH